MEVITTIFGAKQGGSRYFPRTRLVSLRELTKGLMRNLPMLPNYQWYRCNAIVLSSIMNAGSNEQLGGIVYHTSAFLIWKDFKRSFDKVSGSSSSAFLKKSILWFKEHQIFLYFTKLSNLWMRIVLLYLSQVAKLKVQSNSLSTKNIKDWCSF